MERALRELVIVGLPTSQSFHLRVMAEPAFRRGEFDITYVERLAPLLLAPEPHAGLDRPLAVAAALLAEARRAAVAPPESDGVRVPDRLSLWADAGRREALRE
jgi:acetyl/propionyl-CoA carboxylase alpha subunit